MTTPIGDVIVDHGLGGIVREARRHPAVDAPPEVRESDEDAAARIAAQRAARVAWWTENVPSRFRDVTMDRLAPQQQAAALTDWRRATDPLNLVLWGDSRRGKTHAAYAVGNAAVTDGAIAVAWTAADLMLALRTDGRVERAWDRLEAADLVVLDDLGREYDGTGWARSQVHRMLDHRHRERKRTIVTTNLDYDGLIDRYGDPIVMRLIEDALVLHIEGAPLV